jgi:hypothetical protein
MYKYHLKLERSRGRWRHLKRQPIGRLMKIFIMIIRYKKKTQGKAQVFFGDSE